ncbi:MAG: NUDIX hydrolase [Bernardetiaceae bacterium]
MKIFLYDTVFEFLDYPRRAKGTLTQAIERVADVWDTFERTRMGGMKEIKSVVFVHPTPQVIFDGFRAHFVEVPAAGGVVQKDDHFLLMRRNGHWDLPKGKIDPGESQSEAALREVQEECGVRAHIVHLLTQSWHIYQAGGQLMLKPTTWYLMQCLDDSQMAPQGDEGITELRWATHTEARHLLRSSFASLQEVFAQVVP